MPETNLTIADDMVVSLSIMMNIEPDPVIAQSQKQTPLVFLQGHGQIIPGVEQALYGLTINDEQDLVVEPIDGFGEVDPTNVKQVPRSMFPSD